MIFASVKYIQLFLLLLIITGCIHVPSAHKQAMNVERATGLRVVRVPGQSAPYLGGERGCYKVLVRVTAGDRFELVPLYIPSNLHI